MSSVISIPYVSDGRDFGSSVSKNFQSRRIDTSSNNCSYSISEIFNTGVLSSRGYYDCTGIAFKNNQSGYAFLSHQNPKHILSGKGLHTDFRYDLLKTIHKVAIKPDDISFQMFGGNFLLGCNNEYINRYLDQMSLIGEFSEQYLGITPSIIEVPKLLISSSRSYFDVFNNEVKTLKDRESEYEKSQSDICISYKDLDRLSKVWLLYSETRV